LIKDARLTMRDTRRGRIAHRVCAHGPVNWLRRHDLDGLRTAARCSVLAARCSLLDAHCPPGCGCFNLGTAAILALCPLPSPLCHLPSLPPACRTQLFNGVENSIVIGSGYSAATVLSMRARDVREQGGRDWSELCLPQRQNTGWCGCVRQGGESRRLVCLCRVAGTSGMPARLTHTTAYAHHSFSTPPQLKPTAWEADCRWPVCLRSLSAPLCPVPLPVPVPAPAPAPAPVCARGSRVHCGVCDCFAHATQGLLSHDDDPNLQDSSSCRYAVLFKKHVGAARIQ
jgi:hypothetical protein